LRALSKYLEEVLMQLPSKEKRHFHEQSFPASA
jgi:hypothetical protein